MSSFLFYTVTQIPNPRMRVISWNVNGIRATKQKSKSGEPKGDSESVLEALIKEQDPDILCLQEVKSANKIDVEFLRPWFPHIQFRAAEKKGYSGVTLLSKEAPISVDSPPFPTSEHAFQKEGRIVQVEFAEARVVCVYTPNCKQGLTRLAERQVWEAMLRSYLAELKALGKPVILCGDLNCALSPKLDIHNQRPAPLTPGASPEERAELQALLDAGWTDSFRHLYPETKKYTYWSPFAKARSRNVGWRIDFCIVSDKECIKSADCLNEYWGSDHCPVVLDI